VEQPLIVAGVGIGGRDGGQPVLHVQLERGGASGRFTASYPLSVSVRRTLPAAPVIACLRRT
jgi:hypothetical protein